MTQRGWSRMQTPSQTPARCESCDYDLRGIAVGGRCPECGTIVPEPPATSAVDGGRPEHRDSGLQVVAACQYLALIPMSGLMFPGCAGPALGVISVFGPVGRLVALRARWRRSPLRAIEPDGLGRLLLRLALLGVGRRHALGERGTQCGLQLGRRWPLARGLVGLQHLRSVPAAA